MRFRRHLKPGKTKMPQPTPSFLGRARKVKTGAPNAKSNHAADNTTNDAANTVIPQSARVNIKGATKGKAEGKAKGAKGRRGMRGDGASVAVQPSGLALALRGYSTRPDLYDAAVMHDPNAIHGAVDAMLRGAQTAGPAGIADRQALYRMLGLPWATASAGANAKDIGAALGAAYGEAVSRLEGHRGRVSVTLDHAATPEGAENSHP